MTSLERLTAPLTVIIGAWLVAGCSNPNDPRINPKMRYSMDLVVDRELTESGWMTSRKEYRVFAYEWRNPQTGRREVLRLFERKSPGDAPTGFVQVYDLDLSKQGGLRPTISSCETSWTLPRSSPVSQPDAVPHGAP